MTLRTQLKKNAKKGRVRAFSIALLFHGLLAAFLFVGIRWQTQTPPAVQIEVFTPPTTTVTPPPEIKIEPKPEPKPEPAPEPVQKSTPIPAPDLVTEKQKKLEQKAVDEKAREKREKAKEAKIEEAKIEKAKEAKLKQEKDKLEAAKLETEKRESEQREAKQQQRIKDLQRQAGAQAGAAEGAKTGVVDADYIGRVISIISRNTVFSTSEVEGNPLATFAVELGPDCSLRSVKLSKSSKNIAWDQAAERAIRKTDPFPKPRDGNCPAKVDITHRPQQ